MLHVHVHMYFHSVGTGPCRLQRARSRSYECLDYATRTYVLADQASAALGVFRKAHTAVHMGIICIDHTYVRTYEADAYVHPGAAGRGAPEIGDLRAADRASRA